MHLYSIGKHHDRNTQRRLPLQGRDLQRMAIQRRALRDCGWGALRGRPWPRPDDAGAALL